MAFNDFEIGKIKILMNDFNEKRRPPLEIREKLDISYRIENQSVIIYEIREDYIEGTNDKILSDIAKTTYIKSSNKWKLFWMRADLKWHGYQENLLSDDLKTVLDVIDNDKYGCFWG